TEDRKTSNRRAAEGLVAAHRAAGDHEVRRRRREEGAGADGAAGGGPVECKGRGAGVGVPVAAALDQVVVQRAVSNVHRAAVVPNAAAPGHPQESGADAAGHGARRPDEAAVGTQGLVAGERALIDGYCPGFVVDAASEGVAAAGAAEGLIAREDALRDDER